MLDLSEEYSELVFCPKDVINGILWILNLLYKLIATQLCSNTNINNF